MAKYETLELAPDDPTPSGAETVGFRAYRSKRCESAMQARAWAGPDGYYKRIVRVVNNAPSKETAPKAKKGEKKRRGVRWLTCSRCRYEKPLNEYYKNRRDPPECMRCCKGLEPKPSRGPQPHGSKKARQAAAHGAMDAEMDRAIARD